MTKLKQIENEVKRQHFAISRIIEGELDECKKYVRANAKKEG